MSPQTKITISQQHYCECGEPCPDQAHMCPQCGKSIGAPNVRICQNNENVSELQRQFESKRKSAEERGCLDIFDVLKCELDKESSVVVSIPCRSAISFVNNPVQIYTNYESLCGAGVRIPSTESNDRMRISVSGALFGSYAKKIMYGALSINGQGVKSYGQIFFKLKEIAIRERTSFLERNSYHFAAHYLTFSDELRFPLGKRADWSCCNLLAINKISDRITPETKPEDFHLLVLSNGMERKNDEFIEAHVFGGFNVSAVESFSYDREYDFSQKPEEEHVIAIIDERLGGLRQP